MSHMKQVGAGIAFVGGFFWAWPRPLGRALINLGLIESKGIEGLRDAYRVLGAIPWVTLFGVLLFVGGHIADSRQRVVVSRRARQKSGDPNARPRRSGREC